MLARSVMLAAFPTRHGFIALLRLLAVAPAARAADTRTVNDQ